MSPESNGFELEMEYVPIDNLYLRGTYNHIRADFQGYDVPNLEIPGTEQDLSSALSNRAPTDSWYLSTLYSINFASGVVSFNAVYRFVDDYQTNPLIPIARVNNYSTWDLSVDYRWKEWTFRLFSQNVNDKRYLQNVVNLNDGDIVALNPAASQRSGLVTYSEYNQPRYTGFEIIYKPDLARLFH